MPNTTLLLTFAQPNPAETEVFQGYVAGSTELALAAGAEVGARFGVRHLHGDAPATVFGLASFPDPAAITTMFDSPEYLELIPARDRGLDSVNAYVSADAPAVDLPDPNGVYLVTVAAPNTEAMDDLAAYQQVAGPLSAKHGGRPVANFPVSDQPVGSTAAAFVGVVEFPSADAVDAFFADPDYEASIPTRDRALASLDVYVTG